MIVKPIWKWLHITDVSPKKYIKWKSSCSSQNGALALPESLKVIILQCMYPRSQFNIDFRKLFFTPYHKRPFWFVSWDSPRRRPLVLLCSEREREREIGFWKNNVQRTTHEFLKIEHGHIIATTLIIQ